MQDCSSQEALRSKLASRDPEAWLHRSRAWRQSLVSKAGVARPVAGWLVEGWGRSRPRRGPGQSGSVPAAMRCGPPHHAGGPQPHPGQHKVRSMFLQQSRKSQRKCPADGTDELHCEPGMAAAAGCLRPRSFGKPSILHMTYSTWLAGLIPKWRGCSRDDAHSSLGT